MELLVLEHDPATGVARFQDVLEARTGLVPWRRLDATTDELPHQLDDVAGIVVMGGPQSVATGHGGDQPWLAGAQDLLRRAVDAEVPVLAVCLGAQVLATASGGEVTRLSVPEVGYLPLTHVMDGDDEDVTAAWPDGAASLLLHEDAVTTLPPEAVPLLLGPSGPVAWRFGSAVATQAHPEVDAAQLAAWLQIDGLVAVVTAAGVEPEALLAEAERRDRFVTPLGQALVGRFIDGPVRRRATSSTR